MDRSKRSIQEVVASAAIANCYKRFKSTDAVVTARDHDDELIHELEDGRSGLNSRQIILGQYWQGVLVSPIGAGEPSTQIKFTPRYHALSVPHKLRLLEATQRDEIAADLLKTSFQTMSVAEQLELLRLSPFHKTEIGTHIMLTQFPVISDELRMRFLEVAPKSILVTMLEKHMEWLSVREALTAAQNLDDRQYADIRRQASELIWKRRDICDIDDLAKLGQVVLPKFGREIIAEIRNRCRPMMRKSLVPMSPPRVVQSPILRPNNSSSLAILFPTLMAKCYEVGKDGDTDRDARFIGHGPLISIPPYNREKTCNRASFAIDLVVDWASAEYGFVHVILTKELGEFIEAVVSISDGIDREIDVGVIDDDSPSLEIPWPMPRLGTPSSILIRAYLQQTEPDDDDTECQESSHSQRVQVGSCHNCLSAADQSSMNEPVSIDSIVEELMCQEEITDVDQIKLRLVYNDPRIKPLVDMIIAKANLESTRTSNA